MKNLLFFIAGFILTGLTVNASTTNSNNLITSTYIGGYGNSFIFVENGIEFSVFPDGQFDFNILRGNSRFNASFNSPHVSISFNSGYDYNAFVQYDEFGAVIQIENTPIFYDYYGRITQAGNVNIRYNNFGYVNRVGGLYVHYNRYNVFSHCTGFINIYNRHYAFRPWHRFYAIPSVNYCVVYNRPYRRFYNPVRYVYSRPFYNNYRPITSVASRRGTTIIRNRNYATVNRSSRNVTSINRNVSRREFAKVNNSRYATTSGRNAVANRSTRSHDSKIVRGNSSGRNNTIVTKPENRRNSQIANTKGMRENVSRTTRPARSSHSITRDRNYSKIEKPKSTKSRNYNSTSSRRTPQVVNRSLRSQQNIASRQSTQRKSSSPHKSSVSRSSKENNSRATQSRSSSRDTRSTLSRRRS